MRGDDGRRLELRGEVVGISLRPDRRDVTLALDPQRVVATPTGGRDVHLGDRVRLVVVADRLRLLPDEEGT